MSMKLTVVASGSAGNCYVLEGRTSALIIECGVSPERVMAGTELNFGRVAGVLVTHEHGDHAGYVQRFKRLGLQVYATPGTGIALREPVRELHPMAWRWIGGIGEFFVLPFEVRHDAAEPVGFVIKHDELGTLLFITDTAPMPWNFHRLKVDHIMIEANYDHAILNERLDQGDVTEAQAVRVRRSHLSIRDAIEFVKANEDAELKTVTLLHLSSGSADRKEFQRRMQDAVLFADVEVARPGLVRELKATNEL